MSPNTDPLLQPKLLSSPCSVSAASATGRAHDPTPPPAGTYFSLDTTAGAPHSSPKLEDWTLVLKCIAKTSGTSGTTFSGDILRAERMTHTGKKEYVFWPVRLPFLSVNWSATDPTSQQFHIPLDSVQTYQLAVFAPSSFLLLFGHC